MNNYEEIHELSKKVSAIDDEEFEEDEIRELCAMANYRFMTAYRTRNEYALQLLHAVRILQYASRIDQTYYDHFVWHIECTLQNTLDAELLTRAFLQASIERDENIDGKQFIEQWFAQKYAE